MSVKKKILLFSRCELTYLYGSIDKYLKDTYEMLHVAYSDEEEYILKSQFGIEYIVHFKNEMKSITQEELSKIDLQEIDDFLLRTTSKKFNVNGALSANRTGKYLTYEQNIILLKTYYLVWKRIFSRYKIDFFFHEPVSLLMVQMAASFCKETNAIFSTNQSLSGIDDSIFYFTMIDDYMGEPTYLIKHYNTTTPQSINENRDKIKSFISKTRESLGVFSAVLGTGSISVKDYYFLRIKSFLSSIKKKITYESLDPIIDSIELFFKKDNLLQKKVSNLNSYKNISFEDLDTSKKYYYYPIHLEPEASVLYLGDNKYTNQIKLIENIAAQLPPDTFLYVKDHPHFIGYRNVEDYNRLKVIPNVKLLRTSIPGKQVIYHCKGVITINGTGGFEALMMNKQVISFGYSFYKICKRVHYLENVFDLRELLYSLKEVHYEDDEELYRFTLAYLRSLLPGFVDFFSNVHNKIGLDLDKNGQEVASSLSKWINFVVDE